MKPARELAVPILLAGAIATGVIGAGLATKANNDNQLRISCQTARANIDQLAALREISDRLGIPVNFKVPEEPPECDDS